jgi:hypothetical protein
MKFPEPTVNIQEIVRKYHHAELEEEKKTRKLKMETTDNRSEEGHGQQKRQEDRSKRQTGQEIRPGTPAWEGGAAFGSARGQEAGGSRQITLKSRERRANH